MATNVILHKDGSLTGTLTVAPNSTADQDAGFDLINQESALLDLKIAFEVTGPVVGNLTASLISDTVADLSSPTLELTDNVAITAAGVYEIPIPQSFPERYAGLRIISDNAGETATITELFLSVPMDNR